MDPTGYAPRAYQVWRLTQSRRPFAPLGMQGTAYTNWARHLEHSFLFPSIPVHFRPNLSFVPVPQIAKQDNSAGNGRESTRIIRAKFQNHRGEPASMFSSVRGNGLGKNQCNGSRDAPSKLAPVGNR
jgi:hypothetical protein